MTLPTSKLPEVPTKFGWNDGDTRSFDEDNRALLDILPTLIWITSAEGACDYFNKAWHDYTGTERVQTTLSPWLNLVHPDDYLSISSNWQQCLNAGSSFVGECRLHHRSGKYRWFLVQAQAQRDEYHAVIRWIGSCTDIHEQKHSQAVLRENSRLREMLDASIDCIKVIRPDGSLSTMNRSGCMALGVPETSHFGMEWLKLLPKEVQSAGQEALACARRGDSARFAGQSQRPGQEPQFWDNLLTPLKDSSGRITTILCVSREVTLQREAETRLRNSEDRLRLALEAGNLGICDVDLITNVMHCDERSRAAFGLRETTDVVLQDLIAAIHSEDRPKVKKLIDAALNSSGEGRFDAEFRTIGIDDGVCRWIVAKGRISFERSENRCMPVRFSGTILDVTEKAVAEQEVLKSQNRAREVLERTTDAVFMLNSDWEFTYLNPNAAHLISLGQDLVGKKVWNEFPDAADREFGVQFHRVLEEGSSVQFEEFYPAPLNRWFDVHAYPMQNGIAVFFRDSTERRKSEEALIRSEKLAAAGRLAASVSHVINNPLEAVTNLLYLVDQDATLSQTSRDYLKTAQEELGRISQIAIQTLQFYRQSTSASEVRLEDQLDMILGFYQGQIHSGSITVLRRYRHQAPVLAFAGELRQVFTNLIGNAIDALTGSGRLIIRTSSHSQKIFGRDYVLVSIADTGKGMSRDTLAKSFEPFFSTKGITGTGLGLWVSKGIIEKHGGKIRVRSREHDSKHGSVFMIWIPLSNAQILAV